MGNCLGSDPAEPTIKSDIEADGNISTCCNRLLCCGRDECTCPSTCCTITIETPIRRTQALKAPHAQSMN